MKAQSLGYKLFNIFNILFFIILSITMIVPFLNVITLSLEPAHIAAETGVIHLFPKEVTLDAYILMFSYSYIAKAFRNSVFVSVVGGLIGVILTATFAYGISDEKMPGNRLLSYLVMFTMMFSGGIIPSYILIKQLGLLNSLWSLILPSILTGYNILLMRSFFKSLPSELPESAKIDGCSEIGIFFKIILPLSMPIISTIILFIMVGRWNSFFDAVMYITRNEKKTLQVILREILIQSEQTQPTGDDRNIGKNVKMATAVIAITPILCVYPFLQKHFAKGILLGSVKG